MNDFRRAHVALAVSLVLGLGASACDVVLGYSDPHPPITDLNYCDCFSTQTLLARERCDDGLAALADDVGTSGVLDTLNEIVATCDTCSTDVPTILECYNHLPDLAEVGEGCIGPQDCKSLACCPTTYTVDGQKFLDGEPQSLVESDFRCCPSCAGCGDELPKTDLCIGTAAQAAALAVSVQGKGLLCPADCIGVTTSAKAIDCYNCLLEKNEINVGLCAPYPDRPIEPSLPD